MGHLILPRSAGLAKPPEGAGVNWSHPLADRLLWAAAPGAGVSGDLIDGQSGTLLGTGTWGGQTTIGAALDSANSTNDGAYWPWTDRLASLTDTWTIAVWADPASLAAGGYDHLLCIPYRATGWTTPYLGLSFGRYGTTGQLSAQYAESATAWITRASTSVGITAADPLTLYLVTRKAATFRFFVDAYQLGADVAGVTTAIDLSGKQPITLLNRSSTSVGEGLVGRSPLAAIWGRALSDDEVAWLAAEPFAFVQRPGGRLFVPAAAPPAGDTPFPYTGGGYYG